ncbi:flagellar hook-basal body protein [Fictibacillus aquaticus]|uniref:Flagellar biosynthesis protein FlgC n=1 Tax=Fictibacillus aquaticus TaxID=2021314 RepID=A0A235F841_9BACL|nr:flagellar hook-basal body protein [Fictibacillus aquaticus]OYD57470.1 flagellar biosynthesis protein FlgC [Fictibacillus aquaticus]
MIRGFYNAAAGMLAQQRKQELLSNNIANANTPGFKADSASLRAFPNMLLQQMNNTTFGSGRAGQTVGTLSTGVYLQETIPDFRQGDIRETGIKTDFALLQGTVPVNEETGKAGALFFVVNVNGEDRLTRNGHFTVDADGRLTTADGHTVLNTEGDPITVSGQNFSVTRDGRVLDNGRDAGQINVAFVENPDRLAKEGNGLFRAEGPITSAIGNGNISYGMQQGFLERSTVDVEQNMADMMNAYRSFEANQRVLQSYDRSLEKTVNEVGRIG